MTFSIKVPASTANLGCAFDTAGISLSLYLTLLADFDVSEQGLSIECSGEGADQMPRSDDNLIIQSFLHLVHRHSHPFIEGQQYSYQDSIKGKLNLRVDNQIPLSRGLGSSASAIVAGIVLSNLVFGYGLSKDQLFKYILELESHPDNVGASLYGGMMVAYTSSEGCNRISIPWNSQIKCVCVVPDFELSTKKARGVLPLQYSRSDVVFNIQRVAVLVGAFLQMPSVVTDMEAELVHQVLQDRIHQPYRQHLILGLKELLELKPGDGLMGVVLSGAGPTVLAFCYSNYSQIGARMSQMFTDHQIKSKVLILDVEKEGAVYH